MKKENLNPRAFSRFLMMNLIGRMSSNISKRKAKLWKRVCKSRLVRCKVVSPFIFIFTEQNFPKVVELPILSIGHFKKFCLLFTALTCPGNKVGELQKWFLPNFARYSKCVRVLAHCVECLLLCGIIKWRLGIFQYKN